MTRRNWTFDRFKRDERGVFAVIAAIGTPVAISAAVLGTEVGLYAYRHQSMQGAADAAAISGAISKAAGAPFSGQAKAVTAAQGYADGVNGATVTVNSPPASGAYTADPTAVEVIVAQPQQPILAKFISTASINIRARAVAVRKTSGGACILALNKTADRAINVQGSATVTLKGCDAFANSADPSALLAGGSSSLILGSAGAVGGIPSTSNITATGGIYGGAPPVVDPYADVDPGSCSGCTPLTTPSNSVFSPGLYTRSSVGQKISITSNATFLPGVYYFSGVDVDIQSGSTVTGNGVTFVFTSGANGNNYGTLKVAGSVNLNLTAPDTGATAGIVIFGDRRMTTTNTFNLTGGDTQQLGGAIYVPGASLNYHGGATSTSGCTQLISSVVTFIGNSKVNLDCSGSKVKPIGNQLAQLVE